MPHPPERKNKLQRELKAAVAGGVTTVCAMPDTKPALDEPGLVQMLRHRADVLKACDEGIMLKRLIKNVAEMHGLAATFMAKPIAGEPGSAMHVHHGVKGFEPLGGFNRVDVRGFLQHGLARSKGETWLKL